MFIDNSLSLCYYVAMSTETFSPTQKDIQKERFQRSDRVQDHGTKHNSQRWKDLDYSNVKPVIDERAHLESFTSSQLEKEADRLLAEHAKLHDQHSADNLDENLRYVDERSRRLEKDEEAEEEASSHDNLGRSALGYASDADLSAEMSVRRQMRGRRGSTSSPDFVQEGHHGDDEDLGDTAQPLGGYQIR
jgi:hypothetical protein